MGGKKSDSHYKNMKHQASVIHLSLSTSEGTMMKLSFVIVLLLAGHMKCSAEVAEKGDASRAIEKRVLGSRDCGKDRQYHVEIEAVQGGKTCGGSLLNTRWVITAAHCADQKVKVKLGLNNDVSVLKKAWSFAKSVFSKSKYEQTVDITQQFKFKDDEDRSHYIMLIKLNEDMSGSLPTIQLPPVGCTRPEIKHQVEIGGWGPKKANSVAKADKLRCATTEIEACEDVKLDLNYHSDDSTTMCAFKAGVEACLGDAGSAVEYNNVLHGIILSNSADKCANPIVMLDICYYREWIEQTMRKS